MAAPAPGARPSPRGGCGCSTLALLRARKSCSRNTRCPFSLHQLLHPAILRRDAQAAGKKRKLEELKQQKRRQQQRRASPDGSSSEDDDSDGGNGDDEDEDEDEGGGESSEDEDRPLPGGRRLSGQGGRRTRTYGAA